MARVGLRYSSISRCYTRETSPMNKLRSQEPDNPAQHIKYLALFGFPQRRYRVTRACARMTVQTVVHGTCAPHGRVATQERSAYHYLRLFKTIQDCSRLFKTVQDYQNVEC
jgi:hypothetical protein